MFNKNDNDIIENYQDKYVVVLVLDNNCHIVDANSNFLKITGKKKRTVVNCEINTFIDWESTYINRLNSRFTTNNLKIILESKLKYEKEFFCYIKNFENQKSYPVKFNFEYDTESKQFFLFGRNNNKTQTILDEFYCHFPFTVFAFNTDKKIVYLNDDLRTFGLNKRENYIDEPILRILNDKSNHLVENLIEKWAKHVKENKNKTFSDIRRSFGPYPPSPIQLDIKDIEKNNHATEVYYRAYSIENEQIISGLLRSNISQKKAIEKAFHSFDNTPHPIYRYAFNYLSQNKREQFIFTYVNKAFENIIGYKEEEIIGQSLFNIFYENDFNLIYSKVYKRFKLEPIETSYKFYIRKKDGSKFHAMIHAFPFIYHDENPLFVQGALHDLTKEDEYREKIENTNLNLELMISGVESSSRDDEIDIFIKKMFDTIMELFDENWGILFGLEDDNDETKVTPIRTHGYYLDDITDIKIHCRTDDSLKRLLKKCNNELIKIRNPEIKKTILSGVIKNKRLFSPNEIDVYSISFSSYDTPEYLFIFLAFPDFELSSIDKSTINYLKNFVINRLDRQRNERETRFVLNSMESSSKQITLGEISWEITHEVGNTVNNLASSIALLYENPIISENDELFEEVSELAELIDDATEIVSKHRTWYNPTSKIEVFDPNIRLKEIIDVFRKKRRIKSSKIKLTFKPDKVYNLKMVKVRFSEICFNLILNSYQAIPEKRKGHIHVSTGISDKMVFIKIVDDGTGIMKQDMKKIFGKFSTKKNGTGLGLYVSKRFAEEVKSRSGKTGQIDVRNNNSGTGVTFTVYLPWESIND